MSSQVTLPQPLFVYGAGGHGWVIADAAVAASWHVLGFIDDERAGQTVGPWSILGRDVLDARECTASIIVAIGDNAARRRVTNELVGTRCKPATIIHPTACISTHATLGAGVYIGPGAIVNAQATIGDGAIINSGAIVEHHAHIGAFAHIAPGATLGGNVAVGDLGLVGLNATIKPNTRLGTRCTIGAGAVVIRDVPDDQTVAGVPAKAVR